MEGHKQHGQIGGKRRGNVEGNRRVERKETKGNVEENRSASGSKRKETEWSNG